VDAIWLSRLKESQSPAAKSDFQKVVNQLQQIIISGHYIFLHLHPHWLDAHYIESKNQWELLDYSRYRFHNINDRERAEVFAKAHDVLDGLIKPINSKYLLDGYRAGGWSIQPFEDFKPFFEQYGIKYDFSVLPGMKRSTSAQQYDFSMATTREPYRFSEDPTLPSSNGKFVEFPISTITIPSFSQFLNRLLLKYLWQKGDHPAGDGIGVTAETTGENSGIGEMVSVELLTSVKLPLYLKFLKANRYMQFISHPKMLSEHNINTFARFMDKAFALYDIETDFMKMLPK
jgi:hypothetical protein